MADSSLDSFFAKKDKTKKSKNKGKFMTSEQASLGQNAKKGSEENYRKNEKATKKDKDNLGNSNNLISSFEQPDEEWKEVEDEREKDYSGLRIQSLSLADREKEEELAREQMNQDGDGEDSRNNEGPQGPWKLSGGASEKEEEELDEPEEVEPEKAPMESAPRGYVPPHMRNQQNNPTSTYSQRKYGKATVPEMDSEIHFPSLAAVSESDKKGIKNDDRSFQSVTRGSKNTDINHGAVKVETGNKYSALRQRDYSH